MIVDVGQIKEYLCILRNQIVKTSSPFFTITKNVLFPLFHHKVFELNICLLTQEWPPYGCGIGTYMYHLARGLIALGHSVTVITHDKEPVCVDGVRVIKVPLPHTKRTLWHRIQKWRMEPYHTWSLRAYKKFKKLCEKQEFDIIETADFGALGRHFVNNDRVPVVVRCHSPTRIIWAASQTNGSCKIPLWLNFQDRYERQQTFLADGIVVPSYALANHLSLSWVIKRSRFIVLPNPIDTELFRPGKEDFKKNEILYVGRFDLFKGVYDLARSVVPVLDRYPKLFIRFVGEDRPAAENYRAMGNTASMVILSIIPKKHHSRILFTPHVSIEDVVSFQQRALFAVVPTCSFENFPYTVLEPMSCGCPVVATHCGGPTEIVTDGVDGLLVAPGDIEGLTLALEKLITDNRLRTKFGREARRTVEQRFAIPVVVPQIVKFYENVIRNYHGKA